MSQYQGHRLYLSLAFILYGLVGLAYIFQGARYLLSATLADYHLAVIGTAWHEIGHGAQAVYLGLLRGFGAGSLCVGLATVVLAIGPLRLGNDWARWLTPLLAGTYSGLLFLVTRSALQPGANPITVSAVLFGLVILAGSLSVAAHSYHPLSED